MYSFLSCWQLLLPHLSHPGTPSRRMTNLEHLRHPQKLDLKVQMSFSQRPAYVSETMVVGLRQKASHPLVNADSLLSCFHLLLAMANGTASSRLISTCTYSTALPCGCRWRWCRWRWCRWRRHRSVSPVDCCCSVLTLEAYTFGYFPSALSSL